MKAFLNADITTAIVGTVTVFLVVFFWMPGGSRSLSLTLPVSLEGKTWSFYKAAPTPAEPKSQAPVATPSAARPKATPKREQPRLRGSRNKALSAAALPQSAETKAFVLSSAAPEEISSAVAVRAVVPPGTLDPGQEYSAQDLIDGYENDLSRYPLDRTVRADGVALTLEGLQRLDRIVVLKVAVENDSEGDFFLKDIAVRAGQTVLSSRSLFRILVEPHHVREGYVIFAKPQAGAEANITLEEDGGKGRSIESGIPWRF